MAKKVEELNELRVEKLNRVKLVEKEKDELEGPMKAALGFLRLENEKVEKTFRQRSRFAKMIVMPNISLFIVGIYSMLKTISRRQLRRKQKLKNLLVTSLQR